MKDIDYTCIIYWSTCHSIKKLCFKPQINSCSSNHTTLCCCLWMFFGTQIRETPNPWIVLVMKVLTTIVGSLCIWETCLWNNAYFLPSKVKDWMEWCMLIQSGDSEALEYQGRRQRAMKIYQVTWGTLTAFEQDIQMAVGRRSRW